MAGDWIKMRSNLWDDPRVARLCDLTDSTEAAVVGGLYWLWATADQHSEDGVMPGLTIRAIDRKTGIGGFGNALVAIGWLADYPEGAQVSRFEEHNGASAKRRCSEAQRKANSRNTSASDADNERTESGERAELEKEKRREEKKESKSKAEKQRATRLPADWSLSEEDAAFCIETRPELSALETAARFRDYWIAQPGAKGCKVDWAATWRNWVRNEKKPPSRASPSGGYESTRDRERREAIEGLTGRRNERPEPTIIDLN